MTWADVGKTMARAQKALRSRKPIAPDTPVRVGVDLGTAFTVLMVTDADDRPLAGASVFADVVRDGVVWDFAGAIEVVRTLRTDLEARIGRTLHRAAVTIPPSTTASDHRAHGYVIEAAGLDCVEVVDEPTAANAVLGIEQGAVVDIGGGTTGIAIVRDSRVLATVDEPSGGTHLSLVIAGALGIPFEEAERLKRDPANHQRFLPLVAPVLEKMSTIVRDAIAGHDVDQVYLVGGTSAFAGIESIMTTVTGVPCRTAPEPMLVTPLGVARWAPAHVQERSYR